MQKIVVLTTAFYVNFDALNHFQDPIFAANLTLVFLPKQWYSIPGKTIELIHHVLLTSLAQFKKGNICLCSVQKQKQKFYAQFETQNICHCSV